MGVRHSVVPGTVGTVRSEAETETRSGAPTRLRLLEVGERLFATTGIDATPTRQICREAGVHQDAIHYHFGTKDRFVAAILEAGVDRVDQRLAERLAEVEDSGRPVSVATLAQAVVTATTDMWDEPGLGRHYLGFLAAMLANPRLRPLATDRRTSWGKRMVDSLTPLTPGLTESARVYRVAITGFLLIHMLGEDSSAKLLGQWLAVSGTPNDQDPHRLLVETLVGVLSG
jgi:AcrR family transcriptional regulator